MKNILITGGAGFIGSHLCRELSKDPENKIFIIDNLHPQVHGKKAKAPRFSKNVTFFKGDITEEKDIHKILFMAQPQIVYHLAAETGTGQSMEEIQRYSAVNVQGTAILLEQLKKLKRPIDRFILSSTRAVYGEGPWQAEDGSVVVPSQRRVSDMALGHFQPTFREKPLINPLPASANIATQPASIYASTKLMQEFMVNQVSQEQEWSAVIFRLQNVYGAGQSLINPYTGILSIFSGQILRAEKLNIFEDGEISRDFVYVTDVVNAMVRAKEVELKENTTLDLGSGKSSKILDIAKILLSLYGAPVDRYFISGQFRAGDIRHALADINEAKKVLDWEPKVSIEEGLVMLKNWVWETSAKSDDKKSHRPEL